MQARSLSLLFIALLAIEGCAKKPKLETESDRLGYAMGINIGRNLGRDSIVVGEEALARGIKDAALDTSQWLLTQQEIREVIRRGQDEAMARKEAAFHGHRERNKKEGNAFLEANGKRKEVISLPSGLQYEVITMGRGAKPHVNQIVRVHYRGTFTDGNEFDSSGKGDPVEFAVNGVMPGWSEALQLMPVGSVWKLYIPPNLGYGTHGLPGKVGPDKTLVFQMELVGIR